MKALHFEKLCADRVRFMDRARETLLEIERKLRVTLFERVEARSSPGGLELVFDPPTEFLQGIQTRVTMAAYGHGAVVDLELRVSRSRRSIVTWAKIYPWPAKLVKENTEELFLDLADPKSIDATIEHLLVSFQETLAPIPVPRRKRRTPR